MTNKIQFIDCTDFFNTHFEDENENRARALLYSQMCDKITAHIEASRDLLRDSIRLLAKVFDELVSDTMRSDFIDLWKDEDHAPIVYAETVYSGSKEVFLVAFIGRGIVDEEVTIYEF